MFCRPSDPADWRQYHPVLQSQWRQQLTNYNPVVVPTPNETLLYPQASTPGCQYKSQ